ncbi:MAG TPA: hypothetical protein DFR83_03815 [Deltaproteobacteria bacterium]|nr:hypothetical protein [Deltaproteobacteria bacterium]
MLLVHEAAAVVNTVRAEAGVWGTLAWALVVLVVVTLPAAGAWGSVLGNPLGETGNHLWMFWRSVEHLQGRTGVLGNVPIGVDIPLMDPVNLPAYWVGSWWGPAVGWRTMVVWNVCLAMLGGYLLARQWTGADGARVAMVASGAMPFLGGVIDFGISESWPLGWFALHTAALVTFGRTGRWRWAWSAGLCLGAVALSGWYHAFYGLLWDAMLVPVLWVQFRRAGLILQGFIGAGMVMPFLWSFLQVRGQWEPRWRLPSPGPPGPRPDWGELPVFGVDLLTYLLPHPSVVSPSKATYLGVVVLLLAGVAVVRVPRKVLGVLLMAAPFLLLGLGYWPTVAGTAVGASGPAKWLVDAVPALMGMSHWFRAVGPAAVLIAVAAGVGAGCLAQRSSRWSHALAICVLADSLYGAPTAWPKAVFALGGPPSIEVLAGQGGIIQLPFDNGRTPFSDEPPRIYQRWQVAHGRPIAENYEGVDALLAYSELVASVDAACLVSSTLPPYYKPPPEMRGLGTPSAKRGRLMADALSDAGFEWIILHRDRCPVTVTPIRALTKVLGPGIELPGGDRAWPLDEALRAPTEAILESFARQEQ